MNIAVNTRLLLPGKTEGIGRFAFETLKRITQKQKEHRFIFFFDRQWSDEFIFSENITPVALFPQSRHPFLWYLWFGFSVPAALKKYKASLFLSPDGYLAHDTTVPQIPVIHDLNFEHYPNDLPFLYSQYYRHYFPKYARKAARIATVSDFSKNDIASRYMISPGKIDVVYNGCNHIFRMVDDVVKAATRKRFSENKPYFLYVGAQHQRKNLQNIFRAFDSFKNEHNDYKLLIAGQKKWWTDEMETAYGNMKFKSDVIFTGRLSDENLALVTASAKAMVYVSYFEGFGIPVIEAMRCGVPVIASNVTSLPEVAGDAAFFVNPFSADEITLAMKKIASYEKNDSTLETLINKGFVQSNKFTWEKTADALWETIERVLKNEIVNSD